MKNIYIKKTLEKFYENKTYKYFPGCSIVKNFDNKSLIDTIVSIRDEMIQSNLFDNYVFLKPSSYHMTVCDLYTYDLTNINSVEELEAKDKEVFLKLADIDYNLNVEMEVYDISDKKILLKPKTKKDKNILCSFREKVYSSLDEKNNEDYIFHISLTYKLIENDEIHNQKIKQFLQELTEKYKSKLSSIIIDVPLLTVFNDMSEFRDIVDSRKNLGLTNFDNKDLKANS